MEPFEAVKDFLEDPVGDTTTDALCEGGVQKLYCDLRDWAFETLEKLDP